MFKVRHKHTKLIQSLQLLFAVVATLATLLALVPQTALAEVAYYQDNKSASCNGGDQKVDSPPYTDQASGKKLYCVTGLKAADTAVAPKDASGKQTCPAGQPGINGGFGLVCVKTKDIVVIAPAETGDYQGKYICGGPGQQVHISIDIGCRKQGNPILDGLFAVIRFLSIGVGLVIIISIIVAGIQYTASRGDPQATGAALTRIRETFVALLIFIFAAAIINWLVPAGLLR